MRSLLSLTVLLALAHHAAADPLPGTKPLAVEGDIAAKMVDGMHDYLDKLTAESVAKRKRHWKLDFSSPGEYAKSVGPNRERFRKIIGVVDTRVAPNLELVGTPEQPALVAESAAVRVFTVRWKVLPGLDAEGLLLEPRGKVWANVVALPDADQTPEEIAGLSAGGGTGAFAGALAARGCRVLVPTLIDRQDTWSGNPKIGRLTNQPHREFVYRMAYELGRHVIGYEVQKVLAAVDWFARDGGHAPIGVAGHGEGGLIALYAGAVDTRIDAVAVSGYFGRREELWQEPIYRNVWGLLDEFGDAELAMLIAPRTLAVEDTPGPKIAGPPPPRDGRRGAAPGGTLHRHGGGTGGREELRRAEQALAQLDWHAHYSTGEERAAPLWLHSFHAALAPDSQAAPEGAGEPLTDRRKNFDPTPRLQRQFDQAVEFTQDLLRTAADRRDEFWAKMDTSSLEKYDESTRFYRDHFHDDVMGKLPAPTVPLNPRTRLAYETPKWKGYEVVLDLYDGVICYGILLVPNGLEPGERRPVVVCQHGLEGRPQDVVNPNERTRAYNSFGAQLADRGYVVFAPQAPYIGQDRFRSLVRKANPLKLSLYSFIIAQHERTLDWLQTLPFVDPGRIAYYGLSYGGKVAMRVGALVGRYCLVICSGDFNEWVWKNVTLYWRGSYMFTGEYEMYEFGLGETYNYAEMARLIAPRPFMVERGHDDGVGLDEWVAHEYARVRLLYSRLKMPQQTRIEFFPGVHEVHGVGTFQFLARHLGRRPGEAGATGEQPRRR